MLYMSKLPVSLTYQIKQTQMDEDEYRELRRERESQFKSQDRKCNHCNEVFYARSYNQYYCGTDECNAERKAEREASERYELKKAMEKQHVRRNPLYPSPSDMLYVTDSGL